MSLRTEYRQMGGRRLYSYQPGYQMLFGIGQSLELRLNATIAERAELSIANRKAIKMLAGMTATDGGAPVAAWLHGPGTRTYTATHASAIVPADVSANAPAALTLSLGIDAWRRHFGRPLVWIITGTVAIAVQSAEEMDDDDPVVTGVLGPRMINNLERLLQEGLAPTAAR